MIQYHNLQNRLPSVAESNSQVALTVECEQFTASTSFADNFWWIDNGATHLITLHREWFSTYESFAGSNPVKGISGRIAAIGRGSPSKLLAS